MAIRKSDRSAEFAPFLQLIESGRERAFSAVNVALIETYRAVGQQSSFRIAEAGWGKGVVKELAEWLAVAAPDVKGFSASNLWRIKQFYETYVDLPKLATLLRELSWSKHLLLLSQCKTPEEKEFYIRAATKARWSHRELNRQIGSATFERTMLAEQSNSVASFAGDLCRRLQRQLPSRLP